MRARGRRTPPISLIPFACAPLSIIGQHAKGIGVKDGVERPRARMFLIWVGNANADLSIQLRSGGPGVQQQGGRRTDV